MKPFAATFGLAGTLAGTLAGLVLLAPPAMADPPDDPPPPPTQVRKWLDIVVGLGDLDELVQQLDDVYCPWYRHPTTGQTQEVVCLPAPDELPLPPEIRSILYP